MTEDTLKLVKICCPHCGSHETPQIYQRGLWVVAHWPREAGGYLERLFVVLHARTRRTVLFGLSSDDAICAARELHEAAPDVGADLPENAGLPNPPPPAAQAVLEKYTLREQRPTVTAHVVVILPDPRPALPWTDLAPATPPKSEEN